MYNFPLHTTKQKIVKIGVEKKRRQLMGKSTIIKRGYNRGRGTRRERDNKQGNLEVKRYRTAAKK